MRIVTDQRFDALDFTIGIKFDLSFEFTLSLQIFEVQSQPKSVWHNPRAAPLRARVVAGVAVARAFIA